MVVYTPKAKEGYGGQAGVVAKIQTAVASANQAYENSNVAVYLNLVHTAEVNYDESAHDLVDGYNKLQNPSDGSMDEVHALRNHDRANAGPGAYAYSYGYGYCGAGNTRDLMSYSCDNNTRMNYLPNPNISYGGKPTGTIDDDCARTVRNTAAVIASFRSTGTPSTTVCATANEGGTATLSCPSGQVIKSVSFASYGTPAGSCGSYSTSSCNASSSPSVVTNACLHNVRRVSSLRILARVIGRGRAKSPPSVSSVRKESSPGSGPTSPFWSRRMARPGEEPHAPSGRRPAPASASAPSRTSKEARPRPRVFARYVDRRGLGTSARVWALSSGAGKKPLARISSSASTRSKRTSATST